MSSIKGDRNKQIAALLQAIADLIEVEKLIPNKLVEESNQLKSKRQNYESNDPLGIFKVLESESP
jgi:hypothetical protein